VALLLATVAVGLALLAQSGAGLLAIGGAGLLIGWAYSAPPLALNSRGFGELCVAVGFGLLIPLGADYVQRQSFAALPAYAGLSFALLALDLLYINQFPDYLADRAVGKHHWVVRLGPRRARWGYPLVALLAYLALAALIGLGLLPSWCMLGLLTVPVSLHASIELLRHAEQPQRLGAAIRSTITALLAHGLLVSIGLLLAA
jgi:1,4-dihydroxy-2-naphthoate octaprenyltransferase